MAESSFNFYKIIDNYEDQIHFPSIENINYNYGWHGFNMQGFNMVSTVSILGGMVSTFKFYNYLFIDIV